MELNDIAWVLSGTKYLNINEIVFWCIRNICIERIHIYMYKLYLFWCVIQRDWLTNSLIDLQTLWLTDRLIGWPADWLYASRIESLTDRLFGWLTERLIDLHSDRLTDWLVDRRTEGLTDRLFDWLTERLLDWLADSLTGRLIICQIGWLNDRLLIDWQTDWHIYRLTDLPIDWQSYYDKLFY